MLSINMELLSVIVPCFNEEKALPYFYGEINLVADRFRKQNILMEFIFIDDGSTDNTLEAIKKIAQDDERVHYISFSRNFGKEAAIYAGLQYVNGDYAVLMDADLQDPPSLLETMFEVLIKEGYDSVATRRVTRKGEPPIRSFFAHLFYRLMNKLSDVELVDGARDYRLMRRTVVDAILSMPEYNRFTKGIFGWIGFHTKWIEYENVERIAGETKWSFWKLFKYSLEGIVGFSTIPLMLSSWIGIIICILSIIAIIFVILRQIIWGGSAFGWPSMVCIITFLGGIQLLCIGILGQYLSKTYLESKKRPIYIVRERN